MKTHVVVGGGSSGLFLCRRLLERDNVILIERGENPIVLDSFISVLINEGFNMFSHTELWPFTALVTNTVPCRMYDTEPQSVLFGRQIHYAQGIGLGGTSNVNAMLWTPGSPLVFDQHWPKQWNSKVMEKCLSHVAEVVQPTTFHSSGVMAKMIERANSLSSVNTQFQETIWDSNGINSQYRSTIDINGYSRMKLAEKVLPTSIENGGKLTIIRNATVTKVIFKGNRAVSVLISSVSGPAEGLQIAPLNGGEIILCAGVFETPRILLRSGFSRTKPVIAPGEVVDNDLQVILPDLCMNLQDHVVVPYLLAGNWYTGWSNRFPSTSRHYRNRPKYPLNGVHGWVNLDADGNLCDGFNSDKPACCQLLFVDGRIICGLVDQLVPRYEQVVYSSILRPFIVGVAQAIMKFSIVQWLMSYLFGVLICLTQPHSRGKVTPNRYNLIGPLVIDPQYLSDENDLMILRNGLRATRELAAATQNNDKLKYVELLPGPLFNYANRGDTFHSFAAFFSTTYFHACGTCRMSESSGRNNVKMGEVKGVVGSDLKVHQVEGLRIADASVIPHIPNSPISSICMAIGDLCGRFILENGK